MPDATLTIISRNYGSWSLRGWLLCRFAGLDVEVDELSVDDASARAELLLLSPSFLDPAPRARRRRGVGHARDRRVPARAAPGRGPAAGRPARARAHCRSICGEMHSGFANLRAALPMDIRAHHPGFRVYAGAQADIERIQSIWAECLDTYGGPFLFGATPTVADAMYAPVCTRFATYDIALEEPCADYCDTVLALPDVVDWIEAAAREAEEVSELEVEF